MARNHLIRLLSYVWQNWLLLPFILVSMVTATLLSLVPPWLTGVVLIDKVILGKEISGNAC